jgi:acyl-CoA reductase-like NAD-dependent aldehyde dehydrogenase
MRPNLKNRYQLFINGVWKDASGGGVFDVFSPATGEKLASVAQADKEDVDEAVDAAWKAFASWRLTSPPQRAKIRYSIR